MKRLLTAILDAIAKQPARDGNRAVRRAAARGKHFYPYTGGE
jgi:hypothetical protein